MKRFLLLPVLVLSLLAASANAGQRIFIDDISVEGNVRFSRQALLSTLPFDAEKSLSVDDTADLIKRIYKTGFYKDIKLYKQGEKLIIQVKERPSISEITFEGNEKLGDEELQKILDESNIKKGRTFNRSVLSNIEIELRKFYVSFGKYGVQVKTELTELPRNRVAIKVKIYEGNVAKIQQINIVGNHAFSDKKLKNLLELSAVSPLNIFSSSDEYSKAKLAGDLETLRSYYMDRGYLRFIVKSSQITLSPDKEKVFISIHIIEGPQYHLSAVDLKGEFKVAKAQLEKKLLLKPGEVFSRKKMTASSQAMKDLLGDAGYAFAEVTPVPQVNDKDKTVAITWLIDPKQKTYVRRINIHGNHKTYDEVFRREFRQLEGAWFSPKLLNRSKVRVQRLSYVSNVSSEILPVPGVEDQVDLAINVQERPSGSFSVGGGFSNSEGLLFNMSFSQQNMLGTGKSLTISFDNSQINKNLNLAVTNPYYTDDGISRSWRLYYREVDATQITATSDYLTNNTGASISYGIPRSETESIRFSIAIDQTRIVQTATTPVSISSYLDSKGTKFDELRLSGSYIIDTRNRTVFANSGAKNSFNFDVTVPGSTLEYYKLEYKLEHNTPLTDKLTMVFRTDIGYGHSYSSNDPLAFFKRYYAGGVYSVRGYRIYGIGPKDAAGNTLGGDLLTTGSLAFVFPPLESDLTSSVRFSLFSDFGTVFSDLDSAKFDKIRYSLGGAFMWLSPMGPLNFSVAEAMNPQNSDSTEVFQFYIGGIF